jgi:hypothetical protein
MGPVHPGVDGLDELGVGDGPSGLGSVRVCNLVERVVAGHLGRDSFYDDVYVSLRTVIVQ